MALPPQYVVIGSSGGDGSTNNTSGSTAAFASLATWEDTADGIAAPTDQLTVYCSTSNGNADTTAVTLSGWVSSPVSTNYLQIQAASTDKAGTSWNPAKYRLQATSATALSLAFDYVRVVDLQITTTPNANNQAVIAFTGNNVANDMRISGCLLKQGGTVNREPVIYCPTSVNTILKVWNTICYGNGSSLNANSSGIAALSCASVDVYNCTLVGGTYGVYRVTGTVTLRNTYCSGVTASTSGTITATYSAFSDAGVAGTGNVASVAKSISAGAYFTNVTAGSENWAIASASSALDNVGTDVSGGTAPLNYTVDILGTTRSAYDIGAHELVVGGGGGVPVPVLLARATSLGTGAR